MIEAIIGVVYPSTNKLHAKKLLCGSVCAQGKDCYVVLIQDDIVSDYKAGGGWAKYRSIQYCFHLLSLWPLISDESLWCSNKDKIGLTAGIAFLY